MDRPEIRRAIRRWFRKNGRSLPWRGSRNAYHVLLSEIMLQQTQVSRVLVKFPEFLRRFPTLQKLAEAGVRDAIIAWRGMGYNSRAVRLHALTRTLLTQHRGRLPRTEEELRQLPGIGRYTASALLASVHGLPEPVVDVNIRRLLSRLLYSMPTLDAMAGEETIWSDARDLLPSRHAYEWNQALMDLGALVCTARGPACDRCPVHLQCTSRPTMRRVRTLHRRPEKSHRGIPHRIYRGRIVDHLRGTKSPTGVADDALGRKILPDYSPTDRQVLHLLLAGLERDGIVALRKTRGRIRASLA